MKSKKAFLGGTMMAALLCAVPLAASAQDYDEPPAQSALDTVALWRLPDATYRLNHAAVEVPSGAYAGEVREVQTDYDGNPTRIGISLRDDHWVWVDAHDLRYDPSRHVLVSNLSYDELQDMSI